MYTILHISDLHRSPDEPTNNDTLIAALVNDRDRYVTETPSIPSPNAIIVSGDIIQGAALNTSNWQTAIRQQYEVAEDFLNQLVNRFLDGDRSRLVLLPGNHDVCWNTAFSAMARVPEAEYPQNLAAALNEPDGHYRWSWRERALYVVTNSGVYDARLDEYWRFAQRFYAGIGLPIALDRKRGFQLFELDEAKIVVAAFESLHGNDCFAWSGALAPGVVGRCYLALRDWGRVHQLLLGVWHHGIQGPPMQTDYMDPALVQEMAGHGFQLGLHGHHHVARSTTQYVHLPQSQAMAVVGAGSLCAGYRELPRGVNRQYNVIVLNDDYRSARVHVREMSDGGHFSRKENGNYLYGFVSVTWQPPLDTLGRKIDVTIENVRRITDQAESEIRSGHPSKAISLLESIPLQRGTHARRLMLDAANQTRDWHRIVSLIGDSQDNSEGILLVNSLISLREFAQAREALTNLKNLDPATARELMDRINILRQMRPS